MALLVVTATILALTLTPVPGGIARGFCTWCGTRAFADALRNLLLFAPVGAALMWNGWRALPAIGAAALLSTGIEVAQLLVPGRQSSLLDLLCNTVGAAGGVLLFRTSAWWSRPPRRRAVTMAAAGILFAVTVWLGTSVLWRPSFPRGTWFGQWTPHFGGYGWYAGRVIEASLGDMPLPSHTLPRSHAVREALLRGDTLRLRFIAGPPPGSLAPIFSIADDDARGILMVAARGTDLVFRYRGRATAVRLDQPDLRIPGALRQAGAGTPQELTMELLRGGGVCVQLNGHETCPRAGGARGWSLVGYPRGLSPAAERLGDGLWMLLLMLPSCHWLRCALAGTR